MMHPSALVAAGAAIVLALSGCVTFPMGQPQPSIDHIQAIRGSGMQPVRVGAFTATGKAVASDKSLGIRGSSVKPEGGSFAGFLGTTLRAEFEGAGVYDNGSPVEVVGELTENSLDGSGISKGDASLAATIKARKSGALLYRREFVVVDRWQGSFMGVEAIPDAAHHYLGLYQQLVGELIRDPQFIAATAHR